MTGWTSEVSELSGVGPQALARLEALRPMEVAAGTVLFSPGDAVKGYVIVLSGRIGVFLVGANGREILLYEVEPGASCVQSTLGMLGGEDYTGEAVAETATRVVLLPKALFLDLLDSDAGFRRLVFQAFARRMQATMHILERVAFQPVDARLAGYLLAHAVDGRVEATQQEIAHGIGSAREVVSRRLEAMAKRGWLTRERGCVTIVNAAALDIAQDETG